MTRRDIYIGRSYPFRGFKVRLVDGEKVRDTISVDFTCGDNDQHSSFVPKGEIWIDSCLSPKDAAATLLHEFTEVGLMAKGQTYGMAHDAANKIERAFRRQS